MQTDTYKNTLHAVYLACMRNRGIIRQKTTLIFINWLATVLTVNCPQKGVIKQETTLIFMNWLATVLTVNCPQKGVCQRGSHRFICDCLRFLHDMKHNV